MNDDSPAVEALVSQGAQIVKLQNESMQQISIANPRVIETVKKKVLDEVKAFPELAERYFYSIPYRTNECDHPIGKMCKTCTFVEGPSIHAALALQRYWGNCTSTWRVDQEDEEHIWMVGVFLDFETNTRFEKSFRASKWLQARGGKRYKLNDQKMTMAMNAAGSKAQRNAILSGVPDPLKVLVMRTAQQLSVGPDPTKLLVDDQVQALVSSFDRFGVDKETLERHMGRSADEWTMLDRSRFLGLYNALMDGEAPESVFGPSVKKTQAKPVDEQQSEAVEGELMDDDEPAPSDPEPTPVSNAQNRRQRRSASAGKSKKDKPKGNTSKAKTDAPAAAENVAPEVGLSVEVNPLDSDDLFDGV